MGICVPKNEIYNNRAEEVFRNFVRDELNDNFILYHNYEVKGTEFDFLLIDEKANLYIIEIKGWDAVDIIEVKDKNTIKYKDNNNNIETMNIKSPLEQARDYKFKLTNIIKERFGFDAKIVHLVCYPRIYKKDFINKRLDIISEETATILKDDLNREGFLNKLIKANEQYMTNFSNLSEGQIIKIRSMFESDEEINKNNHNKSYDMKTISDIEINGDNLAIDFDSAYSILIFLKNISSNEAQKIYNKLLELWKRGTKIHIVSCEKFILDEFIDFVKSQLGYLSRYKEFEIKDSTTAIFNLWTYYYDENNIEENFIIVDGDCSVREEELKNIDKHSNFNLEQFILEHLDKDENIIVRAGAGTGKTYSMISRIAYLIYSNKYNPEDIVKKIFLITFTNDAANNMKEKLKQYFMSYYLLTAKKEAFNFIEAINQMNISTIHSLCKKIIDKYSTELGLGASSKIVQGTITRNKIIEEYIDEFMEQYYPNKDIIDVLEFRTYELRERISSLLEKIEQKNILLSKEYDFGEDKLPIHKLISSILPKIQVKLIELANSEDTIRLSQLIILIQQLIKNNKDKISNDVSIQYLFVDEFQDTDDVQIDIMKEFQKIIGFKFFVVGDIKQCIYRFRGAQDNAFDRLSYGDLYFKECELSKNYRTDKTLLEKFHPIFMQWSYIDSLKYSEGEKLRGVKKINSRLNDFEEVEYKEDDFEKTFIDKLLYEKARLDKKANEKNEKYTIAILVRTNYEIEKIKSICDEHNIMIDADTSGNLYELDSTRDLYTLALALKYNKDPKCLFSLFSTNYTTKREDKSFMFSIKGNKQSLLDYFYDINAIEGWKNYINKLKLEPIMKVIRQIIFDIKPWIIYSMKFEEHEREARALYYKRNLEQVLENIIKSYNNDYITINKLVEILEVNIYTKQRADSRESLINESNTGVRIVCKTVHKSKGLEYDTIILPFCDNNLNDKKIKGSVDIIIEENKVGYSILKDNPYENKPNYLRIGNNHYYDEREAEFKYKFNEEVRILYVALTRAISKVVYFKNNKMKKMNEKRWQDLISCK